ncbi:hypothetical protein ZPAH1_orf00146 [Aeromonas phage ZPAH1]|nr:hypothetical protein ASwh1_97 [Aeromonas phage Aswh_1]QQG33908.1 hypothetical protein ZPAH1_orf00146 [Aeromonas phage ZPAH1]
MTNVQMFFGSRATARQASFGKMTDNGQGSEKRWARTVEVQPSSGKKETMVLTRKGRRGEQPSTTVVVKKSRRA